MRYHLSQTLIISAFLSGFFVFTGKASGQEPEPKSVVLSEFYAVIASDTSATIYWTTESEQNSYQWRLERAVESSGPYYLRATLPAAGNSTMPTYYQYFDHPLSPDTLYYYRLAEIDLGGATTYFGPITICTGVGQGPVAEFQIKDIKLLSAPNPFSNFTIIKYQLPKAGMVSLKVYNVTGQCVRTLVSEFRVAGSYKVRWNGRDERGRVLASGCYIIKLFYNRLIKSEKIALIN